MTCPRCRQVFVSGLACLCFGTAVAPERLDAPPERPSLAGESADGEGGHTHRDPEPTQSARDPRGINVPTGTYAENVQAGTAPAPIGPRGYGPPPRETFGTGPAGPSQRS